MNLDYSVIDSPEIRHISSITRRYGGDGYVEDFRELCFLLNAPPNLKKFLYLCRFQIPDILVVEKDIENEGFDVDALDASKRWVAWFNENIEYFEADEKAKDLLFVDEGAKSKNPLQGWGLGRYALYAVLFYSTEDESKRKTWAKVTLLLWLAQCEVLSKYFQKEEYEQHKSDAEFIGGPYSVKSAGRAVRQLSDAANVHCLELLENASSIYEEMKNISKEQKQIQTIVTYIDKAFGDREFKQRGGGGGGRRGRKRPPGHIDLGNGVEIFEYATDVGEGYIELIGHGYDEEKIDSLIGEDVDPDELIEGGQLDLLEVDCKTTNKNVMGRVLSAKGKLQHIRMSNQLLPFDYQQLTLGEVTELYKYLVESCSSNLIKSGATGTVSDDIEVPLILLLMLVTGSKVDRACELTILKKDEKSSKYEIFLWRNDEAIGNQIAYEWGVSVFEPKYKKEMPKNGAAVKRRLSYFYLPDLLKIAPMVVEYQKRAAKNNKKKRKVFQRPVEVYKKAIKKYLKGVPAEVSDRVTETMISNYVLHQVASVTGDITAASSIAGQGHRLANSRIHYTALMVDHLRNLMKSALSSLLNSLGIDPDSIDIVKTKKPYVVGARHLVTKAAYKKAATDIHKDLLSYGYPKTREELVEYHNLYTAYTVWMFNFSIANRANKNPLLPVSDIDQVTGISTYRDKDFEKPYHARLIWVPEQVVQQLRNYEEHLSAIKAIVSLYHDHKYNDQGFFLTGALKPERIKPSTMKKYLYKKYINAPNNSHRRFLRSYLAEAGHDIESIDALLGHWFNGEEPWSYFSSFNFETHIGLIKTRVEDMMGEIGFRVYPSRLIYGRT